MITFVYSKKTFSIIESKEYANSYNASEKHEKIILLESCFF